MVPPKHPKMIILVGKPMVLGYHHSRKQPYETENGSEDISKMVRLVQGLDVGTLKYIVH